MAPETESPTETLDPIYDLTVALSGLLVLMPQLGNSDARVLLALIREALVEKGCRSVVLRQGRLAELAGLHRSTVAPSLTRLEEAGLIEISEDLSKYFLKPPSIYTINIEELGLVGLNDAAMCALFYPNTAEEPPSMT